MATILNAVYGGFLRQFFAQDAQVCRRLKAADLIRAFIPQRAASPDLPTSR